MAFHYDENISNRTQFRRDDPKNLGTSCRVLMFPANSEPFLKKKAYFFSCLVLPTENWYHQLGMGHFFPSGPV